MYSVACTIHLFTCRGHIQKSVIRCYFIINQGDVTFLYWICWFTGSINGLSYHNFIYFLTLPFHHFFKQSNFLLEGIFLSFKSNNLLMIKTISAKYLVIKSSGLLSFIASDVVHELVLSQIHSAVSTVNKFRRQLLLFFLYSVLFFYLVTNWTLHLLSN